MSETSLKRPLLLVVDDDRDTNYAVCLMLQRSGYRVAAAYEPYGANSMVQDLLPDGVVLDLEMPAGGGRRFFDWMRANNATARIPVVVYSAHADRDTQKELHAMGARAFVDKASPPDFLIATLVSIVGYVPPAEQQPAGPPGVSYGPPHHYHAHGYPEAPMYGPPASMSPPAAYGLRTEAFPPAPAPPPSPPREPQPEHHSRPPTHEQPAARGQRPDPPPPPPGGVPYPFANADAAPPPPLQPQHGEPAQRQQRLQEQLRVQFEMQQGRPHYAPQAYAPPEHPQQPPRQAAPYAPQHPHGQYAPQHTPHEQHASAQPQPTPQHAPAPGGATPPADGEEERRGKALLLLVDDSPDERFSLAVRLRRKGYTVVQASNSHVALELARLNQPDVILTDVHMPGLSGLQLCQMLKNQKETKKVPVFLMSGLPQSISKKELDRVGGSGFFEKPIDLNLLLVLLQNVDKKKKAAALAGFTTEALGRLDELF